MKGAGEARTGVGEGTSVSVPVLSWEAVMRLVEAVLDVVKSARQFLIKFCNAELMGSGKGKE